MPVIPKQRKLPAREGVRHWCRGLGQSARHLLFGRRGWAVPLLIVFGGLLLARSRQGPMGPSVAPAPWPTPSHAGQRIRMSHLPPFSDRNAQTHFHTHLDIFVEGREVFIPSRLGFVPPYSAIHTHSKSGILHVESRTRFAQVTLAQLFSVWGVRLTSSCVGAYCTPTISLRFYINGSAYEGDPRAIRLEPYSEIAVIVGIPPDVIPSGYACQDATPSEMAACDGFLVHFHYQAADSHRDAATGTVVRSVRSSKRRGALP